MKTVWNFLRTYLGFEAFPCNSIFITRCLAPNLKNAILDGEICAFNHVTETLCTKGVQNDIRHIQVLLHFNNYPNQCDTLKLNFALPQEQTFFICHVCKFTSFIWLWIHRTAIRLTNSASICTTLCTWTAQFWRICPFARGSNVWRGQFRLKWKDECR